VLVALGIPDDAGAAHPLAELLLLETCRMGLEADAGLQVTPWISLLCCKNITRTNCAREPLNPHLERVLIPSLTTHLKEGDCARGVGSTENGRFLGTKVFRKFLLNMSIQEILVGPCESGPASRFGPIRSPCAESSAQYDLREEEKMPRSKKSEAERARAQSADLVKHYRAIGPAVLVAALLCAPKKRNKTAARNAKAT